MKFISQPPEDACGTAENRATPSGAESVMPFSRFLFVVDEVGLQNADNMQDNGNQGKDERMQIRYP